MIVSTYCVAGHVTALWSRSTVSLPAYLEQVLDGVFGATATTITISINKIIGTTKHNPWFGAGYETRTRTSSLEGSRAAINTKPA